jgi:hypothetical protein
VTKRKWSFMTVSVHMKKNYDRTRKRWPFYTGGCFIEVTTWAGWLYIGGRPGRLSTLSLCLKSALCLSTPKRNGKSGTEGTCLIRPHSLCPKGDLLINVWLYVYYMYITYTSIGIDCKCIYKFRHKEEAAGKIMRWLTPRHSLINHCY